MSELARREARAAYLAGVKLGDGGKHDGDDEPYWRAVELEFDAWWRKTSRRSLRR